MNWIALSSETEDVIRDAAGVPVEWTLLRIGSNPICQEGQDGAICLTAEAMNQIVEYHTKKGELIPVDSEHYLCQSADWTATRSGVRREPTLWKKFPQESKR